MLGTLAFQSAASALASPTADPHPCAATVGESLDVALSPRHATLVDTEFYAGYALALFQVKDVYFTLSGWLQRRGKRWCVLDTAGDWITEEDAVKFGVPPRIAKRIMDNHAARLLRLK